MFADSPQGAALDVQRVLGQCQTQQLVESSVHPVTMGTIRITIITGLLGTSHINELLFQVLAFLCQLQLQQILCGRTFNFCVGMQQLPIPAL